MTNDPKCIRCNSALSHDIGNEWHCVNWNCTLAGRTIYTAPFQYGPSATSVAEAAMLEELKLQSRMLREIMAILRK